MKQQSNAQIVREELRSVEGKYGAFGEEEPKVPRLPYVAQHFMANRNLTQSGSLQVLVYDVFAPHGVQRRLRREQSQPERLLVRGAFGHLPQRASRSSEGLE